MWMLWQVRQLGGDERLEKLLIENCQDGDAWGSSFQSTEESRSKGAALNYIAWWGGACSSRIPSHYKGKEHEIESGIRMGIRDAVHCSVNAAMDEASPVSDCSKEKVWFLQSDSEKEATTAAYLTSKAKRNAAKIAASLEQAKALISILEKDV